MGREVTINSITGAQDYDLYVCDTTLLNCVYIDTFNDSDVPLTRTIPSPYDTMTTYSIKIVDANNCEIIKTY
jgi:hypothetical protein